MNNYQQQNMQTGSGLTRYRSAPSSYFSSFLNTHNSSGGGAAFGEDELDHLFSVPFTNTFNVIQENCSFKMSSHALPPRTGELQRQQSSDYSSLPQMVYQNPDSGAANTALQDSYSRLLGSVNSTPDVNMKIEPSSSPAGLLANRHVKSEFGATAGEDNPTAQTDYTLGYPTNYWDDSVILSDDFLKGLAADNDQRTESGNRPTGLLSHHLSLPKGCKDLSVMEKLLRDSVPCKIRAKRGFATHPRSIAERVRRTKISERMRKLQELVPNMEKQTNTADMLDLAVDYIKDLQIQVKVCTIHSPWNFRYSPLIPFNFQNLADDQAKCSCLRKQLP